MSIGEKLKNLRGSRTRCEVASHIGITVSALTKYERDERRPRDEVKLRIAKYYSVPIQQIFYDQASTKCALQKGF